jgi:hypothetical protein
MARMTQRLADIKAQGALAAPADSPRRRSVRYVPWADEHHASAVGASALSGADDTSAAATVAGASSNELAPSELFAVTTEHSTLQAARSSTVFETGVRSTLFLGAVSGGLVALAFIGQSADSTAFHLFALVVLPALLVLGLLTHMRLVELAIEDVFYARAMNRVRRYYFDLAPESRRYFLLSGHDDLAGVAANTGRRQTRWHFLSHAATTILVVTGLLAGAASALAFHLSMTPPLGLSALVGVGAAAALAAVMLRQQARSWARADAHAEALFPSSGEEGGAL